MPFCMPSMNGLNYKGMQRGSERRGGRCDITANSRTDGYFGQGIDSCPLPSDMFTHSLTETRQNDLLPPNSFEGH